MNIYQNHATVTKLGSTICPVKDWRTEARATVRMPGSWHFKFNDAKRFIITKNKNGSILVRGEISYKSDIGNAHAITKRGKQISNMNAVVIQPGFKINENKIKDVKTLLQKHFGNDWRELSKLTYYKEVINSNANNQDQDVNDDPICEHHDEHDTIRI